MNLQPAAQMGCRANPNLTVAPTSHTSHTATVRHNGWIFLGDRDLAMTSSVPAAPCSCFFLLPRWLLFSPDKYILRVGVITYILQVADVTAIADAAAAQGEEWGEGTRTLAGSAGPPDRPVASASGGGGLMDAGPRPSCY